MTVFGSNVEVFKYAAGSIIEGRKADDIIKTLKGIKCRGSGTGETSCSDQLALGLEANIK